MKNQAMPDLVPAPVQVIIYHIISIYFIFKNHILIWITLLCFDFCLWRTLQFPMEVGQRSPMNERRQVLKIFQSHLIFLIICILYGFCMQTSLALVTNISCALSTLKESIQMALDSIFKQLQASGWLFDYDHPSLYRLSRCNTLYVIFCHLAI